MERVVTPCPQYNSSRLILPHDDLGMPMGLEFIQDSCNTRLYAYTVGRIFPSQWCHDVSKTQGTLTINGDKHSFIADRFEGGQKLLIPDDIAHILIEALLNCRTCHLSIGPYNTEITYNDFCKCWAAIQ